MILFRNSAKTKRLIFPTFKTTMRVSVIITMSYFSSAFFPIELVFWHMSHTRKTLCFCVCFLIFLHPTHDHLFTDEFLQVLCMFVSSIHLFIYNTYLAPVSIVQANEFYSLKPHILVTRGIDKNMPRIHSKE